MMQFIHDDDGYHIIKYICYRRLVGRMKYTIINVKKSELIKKRTDPYNLRADENYTV